MVVLPGVLLRQISRKFSFLTGCDASTFSPFKIRSVRSSVIIASSACLLLVCSTFLPQHAMSGLKSRPLGGWCVSALQLSKLEVCARGLAQTIERLLPT